jgi:predicted ATP-grasp superfamily ATP-dependent carboligase
MKRVLILDATQRSALAATRSLGRHGVALFTADEFPTALAGCSRFSVQHLTYPSPRLHPDHFVSAIAEICNTHQIDIALPMTELTTTLLLTHRTSLPDVIVPFADPATVESLSDKCSLMHRADSLGIPIPRTWYVDNPPKLPFRLDSLPYPVVLKPGKSWIRNANEWFRSGVRYADNQPEAASILQQDAAFQSHPFMFQEYVAGTGQGLFALYDHGKPLAFFAHRRMREKPPRGGVSVLSESVPIKPELLSHARKLLDKAAWHGIAMVEFKVAGDGTPYLMEINTRFWGSLQLAIDAGVDFPYLLYQLACSEHPEPVNHYKTGIRLRWLLGDLDSLYLTLRDKRFYSPGEKLDAILRFLLPLPFKTAHEVNRWHDLGPFWCELRQYIRDLSGH